MAVPLCICNGVIRSGSTWSFNVCRDVMSALSRHLGLPFGSNYLDGVPLETFIQRQWVEAPGPTVIKAHHVGPSGVQAIQTGRAKAICTLRDPRDILASDAMFMGHGLEESLHRVTKSLECLRAYPSTHHMLTIRYEKMMADPRAEIRRIAAHLGVQLTEDAIRAIDQKNGVENCRKICQDLKNRPEFAVLRVASHRVDPDTHLHENHIASAAVGRWKDDFSTEQGRWVTEYFSGWLLRLGYETHASLAAILSVPQTSEPAMGMNRMPVYGGRSGGGIGTFSVGSGLSSSRFST